MTIHAGMEISIEIMPTGTGTQIITKSATDYGQFMLPSCEMDSEMDVLKAEDFAPGTCILYIFPNLLHN